MAVKNISDLHIELNLDVTDNTEKLNTAARVRNIVGDFIDSAINRLDDKALLNLRVFNAGRAYEVGEGVLYDPGSGYQVYRCTTAHSGAWNAGHFAAVNAVVGAAGGDLSGTYPNPAVAKINGVAYNADPLVQYFILSGRSGGQIAYGGSGASDNLILAGNTTGTPGMVSSAGVFFVNGETQQVGIGVQTPFSLFGNTEDNVIGSDGNGVNSLSLTWVTNDIGFSVGVYNASVDTTANGLLVQIAGDSATNIALEVSQADTQGDTGYPLFQVFGDGTILVPNHGQELQFSGAGCGISRPISTDTLQVEGADVYLKHTNVTTGVFALVAKLFAVAKVDGTGTTFAVNPNTGLAVIGSGTTVASAALAISSTTGALLVPRMTTTQKNAITAVNGMIVYDSTLNKFHGYENGAWTAFI